MIPPLPLTDHESARLELAVRFLINRHAHMAAAVIRLGELRFSDKLESACIIADGNHVRLYFNRAFFNKITPMELAGVLVHEALHFCLRHQQRHQTIRHQWDRHLFTLACEAVINDLITTCFADLKLPCEPITGQLLVGRNVSQNSAEEVMGLLREHMEQFPSLEQQLIGMASLDDHTGWDEDAPLEDAAPSWDTDTDLLVDEIWDEYESRDMVYGRNPLGAKRPVSSVVRHKTDLSRFLLDAIRQNRFVTDWTRPNRKLLAVYPRVILPRYESVDHYRILMAIDASGSIPASFLTAAVAVAKQPLGNTTVRLVSFDTEVYPIDNSEQVRGGGGTSAQAVEDFVLREIPIYPDIIFCLTDGAFPRPHVKYPRRWVWILPSWASKVNLPALGRVEVFQGASR